MFNFERYNPAYIEYAHTQNLKNLKTFTLVLSLLNFLMWADNSTPIFPLNFQYELSYYNVSAFFFVHFLMNWIILSIFENSKKLKIITIWFSILTVFNFITFISYLELMRGSGLAAFSLGFISIAILFSARPALLSLIITFYGTIFYYSALQSNAVDLSNHKMAIISIIILSITAFITIENKRHKAFKTQDILDQKITELNKAIHVKSVFIGHMSHELRTPLNAIIGFSEMIIHDQYQPKTFEKINEYIEYINSSAQHLLILVNDLLDQTKIGTGEVEVTFEEIELNKTLQNYINQISATAKDKKHNINLIIKENELLVKSDKRLLKQVMFNLLANAKKFTSSGGLIEISARYSKTNNIDIIVKDTGKGIAPEIVETINNSTKPLETQFISKADDTGLGLVIVRQLVLLLNGKINIKSEIGIGTEIKLSFPV